MTKHFLSSLNGLLGLTKENKMRTDYHVVAEVESRTGQAFKTEFYIRVNDNETPERKATRAANIKYPFGHCTSVEVTAVNS